ncbi:hypothetical protein N5P37_008036 [Trichoderma harzianum]|nr:hypothetical protein N5P37_008036 [Trichoderma harzianum]
MEAGISAGQGRGESTGVFRGLTLKPLCFDEQGQNKYRIRQSGNKVVQAAYHRKYWRVLVLMSSAYY